MKLETERLIITEFAPDMAYDVHRNSLDEDTRRFVPDEVFETEEAKQYTGKGYASEAVRAFLPYMMEQAGIKQVHGICISENAASRKVMEKCGFVLVFEGQGEYQETVQNICRYLFPR